MSDGRIASLPHLAYGRLRILTHDPVTASEARQSMNAEVMDCFTSVRNDGSRAQ
jgi:hypothetical protein